MPTGVRFVGHAIVSADGMIAAADGSMPAALRNPEDWRRFQAALDDAALVVLGREGHRRHHNPGRRRVVFTSSVTEIGVDPTDENAILFNPAATTLADLLSQLGIAKGTVAITGGTRVFDYFLPLYDRFSLAEVHKLVLPHGRYCFSGGHPRRQLAAASLHPGPLEIIDAAANVSLTHWDR